MVVLNGSPVTIRTWTSTAIGITIPTGATSGLLEVLLAPSMNSSNAIVFDVTSSPLPTGWLDGDIGYVGMTCPHFPHTGSYDGTMKWRSAP